MLCLCANLTNAVFVYLYLGNMEVVVGHWVVDVISFQKIFGLFGLECHIVEIWRDLTLVDGRTMEDGIEDRARILEAEFAISQSRMGNENFSFYGKMFLSLSNSLAFC